MLGVRGPARLTHLPEHLVRGNSGTSDSAGPAGSTAGPGAGALPARLWVVAGSIALFSLLSWVALHQSPWPDPYRTPRLLTWDGFWHPIELNAPQRLVSIDADLRAVWALAKTDHVWVAGSGGLVLHSSDAGKNWTKLATVTVDLPDTSEDLRKPAASSAAIPGSETASLLVDKPPEPVVPGPEPKKSPATAGSKAAQFNVQKPTSPQPAKHAQPVDVDSVCFVTPQIGWVAAEQQILHTEDGGASWALIHGGFFTMFYTKDHGIAGSIGWAPLTETVDGGKAWTTRPISPPDNLPADNFVVAAMDHETPGTLWALVSPTHGPILGPLPDGNVVIYRDSVAQGFRIVKTSDWGTTWKDAGGISKGEISSKNPDDDSVLFELGAKLFAGGSKFGDNGIRVLTHMDFSDKGRGWSVGRSGQIDHTTDYGLSWVPQSQRHNEGWSAAPTAAAAAGIPRIFPAPWYYLCVVALITSVAWLWISPPRAPQKEVEKSIAGMAMTDRALRRGAPNSSRLDEAAKGLSRFLRNDKTEPPLTISINGTWGSGKSSMMNLLQADLEENRYRPVWFNAWHHQKEELLLGALLANVRAQAIPPWWSRTGLAFRCKLIELRIRRRWLVSSLIVVGLGISAGYFIHMGNLPETLGQFSEFINSSPERAKQLMERGWLHKSADAATSGPAGTAPNEPRDDFRLHYLGLLLASGAAAVGSVFRGLKAFGVEPSGLVAGRSGKATRADVAAQSSFRYRFAEEFREVTEALKPRNMLILIDDLDRCRPESVLEVLEAVNFLVSSGEVFVVMGMDPDRVVPSIGLGFKEVAEEYAWQQARLKRKSGRGNHAGPGDESAADVPVEEGLPPRPNLPADATDPTRESRLEFATQYLEKLVNIAVPLPRFGEAESLELMCQKHTSGTAPEQKEGKAAASRWRRGWHASRDGALITGRALWVGGRRVARRPMAYVLVGFFMSAWAGHLWHGNLDSVARDGAVAMLTTTPSGEVAPNTIGSTTRPAPSSAETHRATEAHVTEGQEAAFWRGWFWLLAMPLAVVVFQAVGAKQEPRAVDSKDFKDALEIWNPIIALLDATPRRVKRFLNRVRYLAMARRSAPPRRSVWSIAWESVRARLGKRVAAPPRTDDRGTADEPVLVALCAMQAVSQGVFAKTEWWDQLEKGGLPAEIKETMGLNPEAKRQLIERLPRVVAKHTEHFRGNPFCKTGRELWKAVQGMVDVH